MANPDSDCPTPRIRRSAVHRMLMPDCTREIKENERSERTAEHEGRGGHDPPTDGHEVDSVLEVSASIPPACICVETENISGSMGCELREPEREQADYGDSQEKPDCVRRLHGMTSHLFAFTTVFILRQSVSLHTTAQRTTSKRKPVCRGPGSRQRTHARRSLSPCRRTGRSCRPPGAGESFAGRVDGR